MVNFKLTDSHGEPLPGMALLCAEFLLLDSRPMISFTPPGCCVTIWWNLALHAGAAAPAGAGRPPAPCAGETVTGPQPEIWKSTAVPIS